MAKSLPFHQPSPVIYIDSEETVTDVRQKLEQHPQRQITLVIPPQTQIQGIVSWKLLARYAQAFGKAISILSSNPQVQGWARSVGLQVKADAEVIYTWNTHDFLRLPQPISLRVSTPDRL